MAKKRSRKKASRKVQVPGSRNSVDKMKYEIANEFGVNLGADSSSRSNGRVGGEVTKRLVENGMTKSKSTNKRQKKSK